MPIRKMHANKDCMLKVIPIDVIGRKLQAVYAVHAGMHYVIHPCNITNFDPCADEIDSLGESGLKT